MGTRASFWIGNPEDIAKRRWLGCIAFDGYPEGLPKLAEVKTEDGFLAAVQELSKRNDFADPKKGWPFPWDDDIFLTDYTYAFFDGKLQVACYHHGFVPWEKATDEREDWEKAGRLPGNVEAPKAYDSSQPDSIIIVQSR